jgi:hypothetical protein
VFDRRSERRTGDVVRGARRLSRAAISTLRHVKLLRRALVALSLAGTIAGLLRVRGKGGVPPQHGGWREVAPPT